MVSPPVITTGTFVMVIRMLVLMCGNCPDLAVVLLKQSKYMVCLELIAIIIEASQKQMEEKGYWLYML